MNAAILFGLALGIGSVLFGAVWGVIQWAEHVKASWFCDQHYLIRLPERRTK